MPLDGTRLRYLGGSSNHWGGQSHPFDPEDFQQREWIPHSGWSIEYDDYRRIDVFIRALGRAMGQSNVGRIKVTFDPDYLGWQRDVEWQYHHAVGTRMHVDPKKGVVNGNLRVHSASNLYVARSSVFPTVGHVNPTMNLLALTLRLADHLKAEVKR